MPVLFLAYASNATVPFSTTALVDLLTVSRRNNSRMDVTGMLVYRGGNFLQALEGPEDAVRDTFQRIEADKRHSDVQVLLEEQLERRVFPDWSMGFDAAAKLDASKYAGVSRYLVKDDSDDRHPTADDHDVFEFFASFRDYVR